MLFRIQEVWRAVASATVAGLLLAAAGCSSGGAPAATAPPKPTTAAAPAAQPTAAAPATTAPAGQATTAPAGQPTAAAPAASNAFNGRTIHLVVGYAAGGGFDATARILAPFLAQALPGSSTVVENQVGADSLLAAKTVLSTPARGQDINVVVFIGTLLARSQLNNGIDGFQVEKEAVYLGKPDGAPNQLALCANSQKIQSLDQFLALPQPLKTGGLNGTSLYDSLLRWTQEVGLPIDPVFGYPATAQLTLAFNQGEVDAVPSCRDVDLAQNPDWLDKGQITPLFYWDHPADTLKQAQAAGKFPWFKNVLDVKQVTPDQKSVLQTWNMINQGSNVYAVSKQTPPEVTAALRQAFKQAVENPDFKAAMEKRQLLYGYQSPEDIDKSIADLTAASPTARELMKKMLGS